jgi:eukaryotic-like serine/threonine-protein kinase
MSAIHPGAVIAGKYCLERPLARGGMGEVWVARHPQLDMLVAIKFMDGPVVPVGAASLDEGRLRFEREARAAAQIQSPHVVQIHDYGFHEGTPYMAMELLTGEDLGARLHRVRHLPLPVVAGIVAQLCKALRRAHEVGIVHRDLKPANVFLVRDDDADVVKVLDFGVAKRMGLGEAGDMTQTGVVVGSVHYMSPEQARGTRTIDHRSDLWSIGVIVYRALTGHLPFPGAQVGDVIVKICSEPMPPPSSIRPELGPAVDAFFTRALARAPEERFQNARELAAAFSALAGSPFESPSGVWDPQTQGHDGPKPAGAPVAPPVGAPAALYATGSVPQAGSSGVIAVASITGSNPSLTASSMQSSAAHARTGVDVPAAWPPASGTITGASNTADVSAQPAPRQVGAGAVIGVAAVCGVVLASAGVLFFRATSKAPPAPAAETAAMVSPASTASPSERAAAPSASVSARSAAAPPAPPPATVAPTSTPAEPLPATAAPSASAVDDASKPPAVKGKAPKAPRRVNSVLGI